MLILSGGKKKKKKKKKRGLMILKEPVKLMKKWRLVHLPRKEVRKAQSEDRVITLGSFQL